MEHPFRNAAFGGFNRQDVVNYLEATTAKTRREMEEQQQNYDTLLQRLETMQEELELAKTQRDEAVRERDELREKISAAQIYLEQAEETVKAQAQRLTQAESEVNQLRDKVKRLEPDAKAFAAVKERTAGMELEAHMRAQHVEEQAQEYACKVRGQVQQWLGAVNQQYDGLRGQVEKQVTHASNELKNALKLLENVNDLMGEQQLKLELLSERYEEESAAATRPEAPVGV